MPPPLPPRGLTSASQEEGQPSTATLKVQPVQGDIQQPLPPAADIDVPLSLTGSSSIHSGNSVASGLSSVIMDSLPPDNPSPCRLTLTRRDEGWAVKQQINFPPPNFPDNVPPSEIISWTIDGRLKKCPAL